MQNYDFSTLNSTDFEKLVCDLLNRKAQKSSQSIWFHSFKPGKDRGIDLLYSTRANDYEIVVQVKHFVNSSYATLIRTLKNVERAKVDVLKPQSYVFVTSQRLSVINKKEIQSIFSPYIKSLDDVIGQDDLNDILRQNADIEEQHFKLWFSSSVALRKIMNYKYAGRADEYQENVLKRKLRLFVKTKELFKAEEILLNNKFLIITGEPGVGKTTLSDILVYKHISKDFELMVVQDSIGEVEEVIRDDDSKQLFYFDDFLGHTYAEIQKSRAAESILLKLIRRIEKASNKYLILNTRKFILTSMIEESERFRNFKPLRGESKIEISSYSYGVKRKMLDNHLFESDIPSNLVEVVKRYSFVICNHRSFSPRHLEFFTSNLHIGNFTETEFEKYIIDNLNNPKDIWGHAYTEQITDYDRLLLNTLYSLRGATSNERLKNAFNNRLEYEVKYNNYRKPLKAYEKSLKNLDGGFIDVDPSLRWQRISFINPSLEDFLNNEIKDNNTEIHRILMSSNDIYQWLFIYEPFKCPRKNIDSQLVYYFKSNFYKFVQANDYEQLYMAAIFITYCEEKISETTERILFSIRNWDFLAGGRNHYHVEFLKFLRYNTYARELISQFSRKFFYNTLLSVSNVYEIEDMIYLLGAYKFDMVEIREILDRDSEAYEIIIDVDDYLIEIMEEEISYQYEQLHYNDIEDSHQEGIQEIINIVELIKDSINPDFEVEYNSLVVKDWNEIAHNNLMNNLVFGYKPTPEDYDDFFDENIDYEYAEEYDYHQERRESLIRVPQNFEIDELSDDLPF